MKKDEGELVEIFNTGPGGNVRVQYHKSTHELYVNDKRVVTEVKLTWVQKALAYGASFAIIVQGLMSILSFFYM